MYGYTWTHLPRRWKKMAWATPMTDSTWLQGTRRHAPHFSQKARVFLSLSLSLSAIPSTDSPHPTFPYSLSRCIPLFSLYSHPPLLFIRVHLPPFRFSPAEIFNFSPSAAIPVFLSLRAIFILQIIFQSILNFCISMINVGRCWSWNGENVKDRRRCTEGLRRCRWHYRAMELFCVFIGFPSSWTILPGDPFDRTASVYNKNLKFEFITRGLRIILFLGTKVFRTAAVTTVLSWIASVSNVYKVHS